MRTPHRTWITFVTIGMCGLGLFLALSHAHAQTQTSAGQVIGKVFDRQNQPIEGASVTWSSTTSKEFIPQTLTQPDGSYSLSLPASAMPAGSKGPALGGQMASPTTAPLSSDLTLRIERAHFETRTIPLDSEAVQRLQTGQAVVLPDIILRRHIDLGFWIATLVFVAMLGLIAWGKLHNTLAALVGASLVLGISYLGHPFREDLFIFDFQGALRYVDWNVVFLIMGMMIVIAVIERTGIFQWLAFTAYRISGGRTWLLIVILMTITGVVSAFLDNVTTMLLMTPISVRIALSLGIDPLALLMPEVLASNVVGISTLVGTPTNILIGSYGRIPFTAAMLPVIGYLTLTVPGAQSKVLFYCLSVGSAMGGNGSLIGASANMVTAGIAERAGFPITYGYFFKKGFPALLVTVGPATLWLLLRFL